MTVPAAALFAAVSDRRRDGWYYGIGWRLRGLLIGARGRHAADAAIHSDALCDRRLLARRDFVPGRLPRLRAEMKLPGAATLEFAVEDEPGGGAILAQCARFQPRGVWGRVYWNMLRPLHLLVFRGMADGIVRAAEAGATARTAA
jgi:hypothetical protein